MNRRTLSLAVLSLGVVSSIATGEPKNECDTSTGDGCAEDTGPVEADADTDSDADSDTDSDADTDTGWDSGSWESSFGYSYRGQAKVEPGDGYDGYEEVAVYNTNGQDVCVWKYELTAKQQNGDVRTDCASCDWAFDVTAGDTQKTLDTQCAAEGIDLTEYDADGAVYSYGYDSDSSYGEVLMYFSGGSWVPVAGATYSGTDFAYDWPSYYYYGYNPI